MQPRINIITLGTRNLENATKFYENGLGLPRMDFDGDISFFELNGSWLSLYPWELLAKDALLDSSSSGFRGVTLAHVVETENQVIELLEMAKRAGATIIKPAQKAVWGGFSGYFADLDGHLWEVAHNPFFWPGPKDHDKNKVIASYEKIADWMDKHRSRCLFEKSYLDRAISNLKPGAEVLDLGCGTGEPIGQYFSDAGFQVTGVDASTKMLEIAKIRCPKTKFILGDMRGLNLRQKFDLVIAWNSFFHLAQSDQRAMFKTFAAHLAKGGVLLFTTGPEASEIWSDNGGENLYHAALSPDEYKELLKQHGFTLLDHVISDPNCGDTTVWLARLE